MARTSSPAGRRDVPLTGLARAQRLLATMAVTIVALAALCIVVLLVCMALRVPQAAFTSGALRLAAVVPFLALPIGLLLLVAAIAVNVVVRSRAAR